MSSFPLILPPPWREHATVGLLAPASPPLDPQQIPEVINRLTAQGFKVKSGQHLRKREGYLAGSDEERADDLNAFFADPEVDVVLALRGGYGSIRILPLIDYAAIRAQPKLLLGYSDITVVHHAILKEAGLATFHGPNGTEAFLPSNAEYMRRILGGFARHENKVLFSGLATEGNSLKTVVPGQARGPLLGGNMTCLLRLLGTPYVPDFRGAVLFLEDIGEKAYRVDGLFTHLRLAGVLKLISGLVLGSFSHDDAAERIRIDDCLVREAKAIGVPCVSGAPIGHFPDQILILQGVRAELDATEKLLHWV